MNAITKHGDALLLARVFHVDDPEALPLVTREIPACDEVPEIEYAYDVTPPGGKKAAAARAFVWCVHCREANHWRGFVVQYFNGVRMTVGVDCGLKIYGAEFAAVVRRFEDAKQRRNYLHTIQTIRMGLPTVLHAVAELVEHPAIEVFETVRQRLQHQTFWSGLCDAVRRGETLQTYVLVRDREAEARRDEQEEARTQFAAKLTLTERKKQGLHQRKSDERKIFKRVMKPLGPLAGAALADVTKQPSKEIADRRQILQTWLRVVQTEDTIPTHKMAAIVKSVRESVRAIKNIISVLQAPSDFCEPENLVRVAEWANEFDKQNNRSSDHERYTAKGRALIGESGNYEPHTILMRDAITLPSMQPFDKFLAAMEAL